MRLLNIATIAALIGVAPLTAQDAQYRLAGVLARSDGAHLAVVERSSGEALVLRAGDTLDGGEVIAIDEQSVLLRFTASDVRLTLAGTVERTVNVSKVGIGPDASYLRSVSVRSTLIELDALDERSERASTGGGAAASAPAGNARADLANRVRDLFRLPTDSAIESINGVSFASVNEGLRIIERSLQDGGVVRFELSGKSGSIDPIYVFPE